jgi:hypothetical protein
MTQIKKSKTKDKCAEDRIELKPLLSWFNYNSDEAVDLARQLELLKGHVG